MTYDSYVGLKSAAEGPYEESNLVLVFEYLVCPDRSPIDHNDASFAQRYTQLFDELPHGRTRLTLYLQAHIRIVVRRISSQLGPDFNMYGHETVVSQNDPGSAPRRVGNLLCEGSTSLRRPM